MTAPRFLKLQVAFFLAATTASFAADGWTHLRVGMTHREATAVVGDALLTSHGRGLTVAIYDRCGELFLIAGRVVGWTAPATSSENAKSAEGWQFAAGGAKGAPAKSRDAATPRSDK